MIVLISTNQTVAIQGLEPNTRYELVVRLHADQLSSPWSSVVHQRTLPAGEQPSSNLSLTIISQG